MNFSLSRWLGSLFGVAAAPAMATTAQAQALSRTAAAGSGVRQLRAAQTVIRALARRPPVSQTIPGTVVQRVAILPAADGALEPRLVPALVPSVAHLRARERAPSALAWLAVSADEALRRRVELEGLLGRLQAGTASMQERVRTRHLAVRALADLEPPPRAAASAASAPSPVSNAAAAEAAATTPMADVNHGAALDAVVEQVEDLLTGAPVPGTALHTGAFRVPETAVHDFTQYLFLRNPDQLGHGGGGTAGGADLERFLQQAWDVIVDVVETYADATDGIEYAEINLVPYFPQFEATIYQLFLRFAAGTLYEFSKRLQPDYAGSSGSTRDDVLIAFEVWLIALVRAARYDPEDLESSFDDPQRWPNAASQIEQQFFALFPGAHLSSMVDRIEEDYPFVPFPSGIVNFGLRLVYRQEWWPLGTQPGEIVRTIPLGPKQVERVSAKVVINQREARTAETFVSTETSTEASSVTRESSDVVEEASRSLKWHVDAEASASFGFGSAKLSTGVAGETASSSKDSKSRLNETMQKTASRMRRDVKVVVSTERTVTEELAQASEITNPNDEVAVTYVYSKLQRQYAIQTRLAEVQSVVFVPERIPAWNEIDEGWVRRHDWILGRVLLDSSFAEDLAEVAREPEDVEFADTNNHFDTAAGKVSGAIDSYKDYKGGTLPDLFSTVQSNYERHLERKRGTELNRQRRKQRSERLLRHIRENILHYMRAVWSAEDADQRLRRYARILAPARWTFAPSGPVDPAQPLLEVPGDFIPDLGPANLRPLSELINPAGPVGYAGNYAVYYLKSDPRLVDLNQALTLMRTHYVRFEVTVTAEQSGSPALRQAVAVMPRYREASYAITRSAAGWSALHERSGQVVSATTLDSGAGIDVDGIVVRFDAAPAPGSRFRVRLLATDELEDPELRLLRQLHPLPASNDAAAFFSAELLRDLGTYLPDVAAVYPADLSGGWLALSAEAQQAVQVAYHEYLLLKEHTRRFVLETNNLLLDLEVGQTPGLELFKRLHRVIDVLKEAEEVSRRTLENDRRRARLAAGDHADPDIESVTVVGGADELRTVVGPVVDTGAPAAPTPTPAPAPAPSGSGGPP